MPTLPELRGLVKEGWIGLLTLEEQRKLPGDVVRQISAFGAKPDGSRRSTTRRSVNRQSFFSSLIFLFWTVSKNKWKGAGN